MTITFIRAVIIYIFVTIAVRIMGKRQVGELKPQELVITILISSVATIPLEENSMPLGNSLVPILILISFEIIESALSMKSLWFRNLVQGKPVILIRKGKLDQKEMSRLRFTMDDVIDSLRQKDVFDISQVENAIIETNGTISVQIKSEFSPVTPQELKIKSSQATLPMPIIMDGKPVEEYFGATKMKVSEIDLIVSSSDTKMQDMMLMTIDDNGVTYIIDKEESK